MHKINTLQEWYDEQYEEYQEYLEEQGITPVTPPGGNGSSNFGQGQGGQRKNNG